MAPSRSGLPATGIRAELAAAGARPRKRLGQHFLRDESVADRIARLVRASPGETVVEIGPGLGMLTDRLVPLCDRLVLIELDRALAARARERYEGNAKVEVREQDALKVDWPALLPDGGVVAGNLPYNVATAILQNLLEHRRHVRRIVAMVQKEVADRLAAEPDTRSYGALAILTQLDAIVTRRFGVPPGAFVPAPKVHSEVVTLDAHATAPVDVGDDRRLRRIVSMAFQQRRKQLANPLRGVVEYPRELLGRLVIDPTRRPETLSLAEFARLERESRDA